MSGEAALVGALNRMSRSLTRSLSQFDYRDISQGAMLYVLERDVPDERREATAILKCRSIVRDGLRVEAAAHTVPTPVDDQKLHAALDAVAAQAAAAKPFGLYAQELRVWAGEVATIVSVLPPKLEEVVRLFEVEGKSYAAIAAELGVPLGTVMSRLSQARRLIRERA